MAARRSIAALSIISVFSLSGCIDTIQPDDGTTPEGPAGESPPATNAAPAQPATPQTPEALLAQWMKLAETPLQSQMTQQPMLIAERLALQGGGTAIVPLIEVLRDPEADPRKKLMVVQSLSGIIRKDSLERLKAIVDEETDETSRSCATMLIALVPDPSTVTILTELKDDDEPRVKIAALSGLAKQSVPGAREELIQLYWEDDATKMQKTQVLNVVMADGPFPGEFPVLNDALLNPQLSVSLRMSIAHMMGQKGGATSIESLEASLEKYVDPGFQNLIKASIAAIKQRTTTTNSQNP